MRHTTLPCLVAGCFAAAALIFSFSAAAQPTVDQTYTPQELVENHLVGSGVSVSNVTFNMISGSETNNQIGLFSGPSQLVEFDEGLVMVSGDAQVAVGGFGAPVINISGDPDLWALANVGGTNFSVNNCAILEFDFVPNFEFLTVGYIFGSNEYPSYTCSSFNDVFGFFVSGPGISGPFTNSAVNIAVIPNTNIPVGVNTVNSGVASLGGSTQNCLDANPNFVQDSIYFVNNNPMLPDDIGFPGVTVTMYANIILQPGETYHIKLAVADVSDTALDSGVFLEGASFSAFPISAVEDFNNWLNGVSLNVFPNPASDFLNVDIHVQQDARMDVRILDITGKAVAQPMSNVSVQQHFLQQIDISDLSYGVYLLELTDRSTGYSQTQRFQKMR
jgi:hypothetical protein